MNGNKKMNQVTQSDFFPIGTHRFAEMVTSRYYVDKTLLIKDVIDLNSKVVLFTRPRRFGKTSNMHMLRTFFEKPIKEMDTSYLFKDRNIWQCGERYSSEQGQYPVIWLSFQDYEARDTKQAYMRIRKQISSEYQRHIYLLESNKLSSYDKEIFETTMRSKDINDYDSSIKFLSKLLYKHYEKEVIIIIDEYDKVMLEGYTHKYYDEVVSIFRPLMSGALKDNDYLKQGFLTGILDIGKDSCFSCLNNVATATIFDDRFSQYFGFTKNEVQYLLKQCNASHCIDDVCDWYDGYLFGNTEIFNPWSILKCLQDGVSLQGYWINVGSNNLLKYLFKFMDKNLFNVLMELLEGNEVEVKVTKNATYEDIDKKASSLFSILLASGYLRGIQIPDNKELMIVKIPNKELVSVFKTEILENFNYLPVMPSDNEFAMAILNENFKAIENIITKYAECSLLSFDTKDENSYHMLMLGLIYPLQPLYHIRSNIESGNGRFDIQLTPRNKDFSAIIFEFKRWHKGEPDDMNKQVDVALDQIDQNHYDADFLDRGYTKIIHVGIAFKGKETVVVKTKKA